MDDIPRGRNGNWIRPNNIDLLVQAKKDASYVTRQFRQYLATNQFKFASSSYFSVAALEPELLDKQQVQYITYPVLYRLLGDDVKAIIIHQLSKRAAAAATNDR